MTHRPPRLALLALPAALALAGCASSGALSGAGSFGSASVDVDGPHPSGGSTTSGSSGRDPNGATRETLALQLHRGASKVQSAHIELAVSAAGEALTGAGDERLAGGKLQALRLSESLPSGQGTLSIVLVDGRTYLKLPATLNKSGKPWLLVTDDSTNPVVRQLAQSLGTTLSSASVGSAGAFVDAATSVRTIGRESVGGVPATHVHLDVDPAKLAKSLPGSDVLRQAGITSLPVDMWLDDQYRPVQITESLTASGQHVTTKVTMSRYNQPVTITAPPAGQVGR